MYQKLSFSSSNYNKTEVSKQLFSTKYSLLNSRDFRWAKLCSAIIPNKKKFITC